MTTQQTRPARRAAGHRPGAGRPRAAAGSTAAASVRTPTVIRTTDEQPLGDVSGRVRAGIATWLRSPALDFYALLAIGALLLGTGLVMVLSSSVVISIGDGESPYAGLFRQGRFALIGIPLLAIAAAMRPRFYQKVAWPLLLLGFALQSLVFTPLGMGQGGNRNWVRIGSLQLQPSELLKLALAVWLAAIMATNRDRLNEPRFLLTRIAPVSGLALGLVLAGKDLGTALVMCMLIGGSLWVAGVPRRWFAALAAVGLIAVLGLVITSPNRMARISTWLHGVCEGSSCYQSSHGLMALAEGGWWGLGLGESRQKWGLLPAADNDYIFAILGEELGLFGTLGVLILFAALALVLFRMITRIDDRFVQVTVAGISAWLLGQAFTNMMVVTGILPVLGVPLPFISAGGSALVTSLLALGILLCFARHEPGAADAIRARMGRVRRGATVLPTPAQGAAPSPRRRGSARRAKAAERAGSTPRSERTRGTVSRDGSSRGAAQGASRAPRGGSARATSATHGGTARRRPANGTSARGGSSRRTRRKGTR